MRDPSEIDAAIELIRADVERVGDQSRPMAYRFMGALVIDAIKWAASQDGSEPFDEVLDNMRSHEETRK